MYLYFVGEIQEYSCRLVNFQRRFSGSVEPEVERLRGGLLFFSDSEDLIDNGVIRSRGICSRGCSHYQSPQANI